MVSASAAMGWRHMSGVSFGVESGDGSPGACVLSTCVKSQRFGSAGLQSGGACLRGVGSPRGWR
eukprot:3667067-Alexandrium_andersonii.AAC.1